MLIDLNRDPRDMTDDELDADIKALESRVYTLHAERAKAWRQRLRLNIADAGDRTRLAELHKRRAGEGTVTNGE